ncbi:MAG: hypothetical protein QOJ42_7722, partial [Acidobacteriaceae bacterium]|nr:hypothetical protein [Acidobacteriaceae bacterium]
NLGQATSRTQSGWSSTEYYDRLILKFVHGRLREVSAMETRPAEN